MTTLVVVAQRARARLFEREPGEGLSEIQDLVHPASRAHGRELDTDRHGQVSDRHGGGPHGLSSEETSKERAAADFAREVAQAVEHRRTGEGFDHLVLMAEPGFLGLLRASLDDASTKKIGAEVPKELVDRTVTEIRAALEAAL